MSKTGIVREIRSKDIICELPDLESLDTDKLSSIDLFITACGFEARSVYSIFEDKKLSKKIKSTYAIIGRYDNSIEENNTYLSSVEEYFREKVDFVDSYSPIHVSNCIESRLEEITNKLNTDRITVVFDISGCASTFILSCFYALINSKYEIFLSVIYREAKTYFPEKPSSEEALKELVEDACRLGTTNSYAEYGIDQPRRNELYAGLKNENRSDLVIAIPSFRCNRLERCITDINKDLLTSPEDGIQWIIGGPPREDRSWRTEFQKKMVRQLERSIGGDASFEDKRLHVTSTEDYRDILDKLFEIVDSEESRYKNIYLVDFGSKMQSVGIALFLSVREEVSVSFAKPKEFLPKLYSDDVGDAHMIILGDVNKVVDRLRDIGTLKYEPSRKHFDQYT